MDEFISAPNLTRLGIDEVEANVCEDSFENRQRLISAKVPFKVFEPGLIEVDFESRGDELNAHHANMYEKYKIILTKPKDPWSDYQPFLELPLDYMETAPAWIPRHKNKYMDALEEGVRADKMPILPERCKRLRADGSRCWGWSWPAESCKGMCRQHAGKYAFDAVGQMNEIREATRMRIASLTPKAVETLEDMMLNSSVPAVRVKAAIELLDRDGIRGGTELTVSGQVDHVVDSAQVVRERLQSLNARHTKALEAAEAAAEELIVEAEVVEEAPND